MNGHADVLIAGFGQAATLVVAELREGGFEGSIVAVGKEPHLPYERPPLSKGYLLGEVGADEIGHRDPQWWTDMAVDMRLGDAVVGIDPTAHTATTEAGDSISYDRLVWAAGGRPRPLEIVGAHLKGVHFLHSIADADALRGDLLAAKSVAIIGGGFIGLEIAAAAKKLSGGAVTVLEVQERLLQRVAGATIGDFFASAHRAAGVDVRLGTMVEAIEGDEGVVTGVRTYAGETIPADVVVVGIGQLPNIEPLSDAGAEVSIGVDVDEDGRTTLPDVFAAGDCARFHSQYADGFIRLESVQNAVEQGRRVARVILGAERLPEHVPWFWSNQYAIKFKTVGVAAGYEQEIVRGDPSTGRFSVIYVRGGKAVAIDTVNMVKDYAHGRHLVEARCAVDAKRAADPSVSLEELIAEAVGARGDQP